jgi:RNA polymerase sigma-70 factor, ECF subfamily
VPADTNEPLIAEIRRRLSQAVRRVCPGWLAAQAEDIVQTALMRVLEAANRSGERNPEFTSFYLERAAYFATVDEIRRHRRRMEDPPEEEHLAKALTPEAAGPEALAIAREIAAGIGDCLGRLSTHRRLAVTLHLQGHSVPEVAVLLELTIKRTENFLYRGLAELRRCLATKDLTR